MRERPCTERYGETMTEAADRTRAWRIVHPDRRAHEHEATVRRERVNRRALMRLAQRYLNEYKTLLAEEWAKEIAEQKRRNRTQKTAGK